MRSSSSPINRWFSIISVIPGSTRERIFERGLKMIEKAVELRPEDGYIVDSLGWAHYRLGDYSSAVQYLEKAIELVPEDPTINDHLGDAYWQSGRPVEARYQWRRALQFGPRDRRDQADRGQARRVALCPAGRGGGARRLRLQCRLRPLLRLRSISICT